MTAPRKVPGTELKQRRRRDGTTYWQWHVRWKDPATGRRLVEICDTAQEAEDFKAHLRLLKKRGNLADLDRGRETLAEFAHEWLVEWASVNLAHRTLKSYAGIYNKHLLPRLGRLQLREITPRVVDSLRCDLEAAGVGAPTIRTAMAILQAMFRQGVIWGRAETNPVKAVSKPTGRRAIAVVPFTVDQVEQLLVSLCEQGPQDAMLAELIAYTGARPQDALAVPWSRLGKTSLTYAAKNVDGRIVQGAKTGTDKSRTITLLQHMRRDLLAFRIAQGNPPDNALILTGPNGPWSDQEYRYWRAHRFQPAAVAIGLATYERKIETVIVDGKQRRHQTSEYRGPRPYDLRHTYASLRIAEQRLSLHETAEEMGHSVELLARTYAHVIADLKGQGPVDIDELIAKAREKPRQSGTDKTPTRKATGNA